MFPISSVHFYLFVVVYLDKKRLKILIISKVASGHTKFIPNADVKKYADSALQSNQLQAVGL